MTKVRPRSLYALKREAATATSRRGHLIRWSLRHSETTSLYLGVCQRCEMQVTVNHHPANIVGEALALDCPGYKESDYAREEG